MANRATESGFQAVNVDSRIDSAMRCDAHHKSAAALVDELQRNFRSGFTHDLAWRKEQLRELRNGVKACCEQLSEAVANDLGGPKIRVLFDCAGTVGACAHALDHIDNWAREEHVKNDLFSSSTYVRREPKVYALAAGNCVVIKPSEVSASCPPVIRQVVETFLDKRAVRIVEGGVAETTALLKQHWDHIMYTGNGSVARIVMSAAAKHLTPVTLELGGKSPAIIDSSAKLDIAVSRICMGKFCANAGQTCITTDYVLVERSIEEEFLEKLKAEIVRSLGEVPVHSDMYGKIIDRRHVQRIHNLCKGSGGEIVFGGVASEDFDRRKIAPTIISRPLLESSLMTEEIFGPILPVLPFDTLGEAVSMANRVCRRPLALQIFSERQDVQRTMMGSIESGAALINTVVENALSHDLPFGGIGESGMGCYHGKYGFDEFSHRRSVLHRTTLANIFSIPYFPLGASSWIHGAARKALMDGIISESVITTTRLLKALALVCAVLAFRRRLGLW